MRKVRKNARPRAELKRARLRKQILGAAMKLYAAHGYGGVTLREIGNTINLSAPAIYYYFRSKDQIFLALAEEGVHRLVRLLKRRQSTDPLEAVRDRFWAYYQFSRKHPRYFRLIYVDPAGPAITKIGSRIALLRALGDENLRHFQQCVDAGVFGAGADAVELRDTVSAVMLGVAVWLHRRPTIPPARADAFAEQILDMALSAMQAGLLRAPYAPAPATRALAAQK